MDDQTPVCLLQASRRLGAEKPNDPRLNGVPYNNSGHNVMTCRYNID